MKFKKLVIISHTRHYFSNGKIVGWGATVNEVNFIADYWDEVVHIACFYKSPAANSSLPYLKENIKYVPIPAYGGKKIIDKLLIFVKIPIIIFTILKNLPNATEVQLRVPTSMGLFLLPLFSYLIPRRFLFWVKYAGDWGQLNPPLSNRIQRYWLKRNWSKCTVTINGFWKNQPSHCKSFENPCLMDDDIEQGKSIADQKIFVKPYNFCFVGRLDEVKGVSRIINSLRNLPIEDINEIHIIGEGNNLQKYIKESDFLKNKIFFHGAQNKQFVHEQMKKSHFFLLPSYAEGFPKVVAEAACYGVIPIVSDVGSISHYINDENGFLWMVSKTGPGYETVLINAMKSDQNTLQKKSMEIVKLAKLFTFGNYVKKLKFYLDNR
ncbi:glycosyltransferase [Flavobacterium lacus]|jgi:glycosyltransferase involved in cell wall biosynthesis|uniref:Glycosyltransferase involved in cell wall biosynthesis n=1 Tax=Flavobacterium lacus TaxID=1353778 RepID=A0A328WRY4_9FLAO|nr:glycosyltransferase [Flavobacterium lacus]RAR46614.1 glycosyltransferase involved in cell wall biosynthesis [Flavobacterium lacus]